jgi:hypothetical protein
MDTRRREFLFGCAGSRLVRWPIGGALLAGVARGAVPVRAITRGPKFHWFGYYDKLQFDPTGRYALGMEVDFEHRSPRPGDVIRLGMIDTADSDRWTEIGESRAWNWQQGCMLQWLPGSASEVIWNDREGDRFVSRILDVQTGKRRTLPAPVYTLSPDGKSAVFPDFRRLNDCRPGYGYAGLPDPNAGRGVPDDAGIWHLDLASGRTNLVIPLSQAADVPFAPGFPGGAKHWFNHLLYSPDGSRFISLHRWRGPEQRGSFSTRMFTADSSGRDLFVLDPHGKTSHFIWRDPKNVLAWAWHPSYGERFYLYRDKSKDVEVVGDGVMTVNGHCTYLPGGRYILNDTYPDRDRMQHVYLFEIGTGKRIPLGSFLSPREYTGEWRCDTHPRFSPDGRKVIIDSAHDSGRQMYLIDLSSLVAVRP